MRETSAQLGKRPTPKLLELAAVVVTCAVPLISIPGLTSPFSTPKIALLAVSVVAGLIVLMSCRRAEFRLESLLQKLAVAWLAVVSASSLWGPIASLKSLLIALLAPASFLLLTWLKPNPASLSNALLVSAVAVACIAVAQYLGLDLFRLMGWQGAPAGTVRMRTYATLGNPNFVAAFLSCLLPLTWVPRGERLGSQLVSGAAALLIAVGIIVTGSRAPIVGAICLVLCATWLFPSACFRRRIAGLIAISLLTALIAVLSAGRPIGELIKGRFFIWRIVVSHASVRTLTLGDGPGAFALRYPEWETRWAAATPKNQSDWRFLGYQEHAHNDWLEVLVEHGIPGFVLLLLIPVGALWMCAGRRPVHRAPAGAAAGIAVFAGLACVDFPFHRPAESFVFWTLVAIIQLSFSGEESYEPEVQRFKGSKVQRFKGSKVQRFRGSCQSYPEIAVRSGAGGDSCGRCAGLARRV